jgi:hypothetical protein
MSDPFGKAGATTVGGGGTRPRLHQLAKGGKQVTRKYAPGTDTELEIKTRGRLLLISPKKFEKANTGSNTGSKAKDRVTADVVVLSGEEITEVIDANTGDVVVELEEPLVPASANAVIKDMFISSVTLVGQLAEDGVLDTSMKLGYLGRLPKRGDNNPAYCLTDYNDADAEIARKYLAENHNPFAGDEEE